MNITKVKSASIGIVLTLTLLVAACGNSAANPTPVPSAPAAQEQASQEQTDQEQTTPPAQAPAQRESATPVAETFGGGPALTVEQINSIETYRMDVEVMNDGQPSVQVQVAHVKTPLAEDDRVTLYQSGTPTVVDVRFINDTLYLNNGEKWTVISTFNLAELTVITPAGMASAAPDMAVIGEEEMSGRTTIHLRGDKNVIPDIQSGSDSLSVKNADAAQLDLWLDADERFIVKLLFSLTLEGKTFTTEFLYHDFNAAIVVEVPTNVEEVTGPPTPSPAEVVALLGFDFPIPQGAQLSVVAGTANILIPFSVDEARAFMEDAMVAAGFVQVGEPEERAANEFFYTFQKDDRTVTANVFSVVAGKTTIQIGAAK